MTTPRSTRDQIRAKILAEQVKRVTVTLDGMDIEVRQMTVGNMLDSVSVEDRRQQMANYLIECCFVPGTDEHIFEAADLDVLMSMPAGGYYSRLMDEINKQTLGKQIEVAEKS